MNREIKVFTAKELGQFFKAIEDDSSNYAIRNEALFKIIYYYALKVGEASALKKQDFNYKTNEINCRKKEKTESLEILDENILRALKRYLDDPAPCENSEIMFPSSKATELNRRTVDEMMKKYCVAAGIKDKSKWHTHILRNTRAFVLKEGGFGPQEIKFWLGFENLVSTEIYFQKNLDKKDLYKKLRKMGSFFK